MDELKKTNPFRSPTVVPSSASPQTAEMDGRICLPLFSMLIVFLAGLCGAIVAMCLAANQWPDEVSSSNLVLSSIFGLLIGLTNMIALVVAAYTMHGRLSRPTNLLAALFGVAVLSYLFNLLLRTLASC